MNILDSIQMSTNSMLEDEPRKFGGISTRPWGVALPGQRYPQVEGPGNPSWEARNPQLAPQQPPTPPPITRSPFPEYPNLEDMPRVVPGNPPPYKVIPGKQQPFPESRLDNETPRYIQPVVQRPDGSWYNPYLPENQPTPTMPNTPKGGANIPQPTWGVEQPGMQYPQVEGPGNPSWERRNPDANPNKNQQPINPIRQAIQSKVQL